MTGRFEIFSLSLSQILTSWNKIANDEMKPFGLKGAYVIYLISLFKCEEGLTASNLCELCNKDRAEVSRAINAMEGKGLVIREKTTPNRYRAKITLTDEGKEVTHHLRERIKLAVEKGGEGLSEEERENFYKALQLIRDNLKEITREGL